MLSGWSCKHSGKIKKIRSGEQILFLSFVKSCTLCGHYILVSTADYFAALIAACAAARRAIGTRNGEHDT